MLAVYTLSQGVAYWQQ